jgi:hypothetical protein
MNEFSGFEVSNQSLVISNKEIEIINIPLKLINLPDECFANCHHLKVVFISKTITFLGRFRFRDCNSLKSVVIPNSVTSMRSDCFFLNALLYLILHFHNQLKDLKNIVLIAEFH